MKLQANISKLLLLLLFLPCMPQQAHFQLKLKSKIRRVNRVAKNLYGKCFYIYHLFREKSVNIFAIARAYNHL